MIKYNNKKYVCLLDLAMDFIRGKWKAVILCHLLNEPKRFLELQRITNGVSHKVLTEKLKELEEDNLIQKIVYDENPPKVEYKLTPMGKDLSMAIKEIEKWSLKYYGNIVREI
ncbi:helix-turn-helix domain-containing protein [Clostridium botulinum]|uniref:winged helix-turn-helix transcriptional regulator n=1 Tax=Clostridium botulinum TaxID=1491 RepID=UPI001C9AE3CE|nr:helix-turn-helix domain-containing protein [Clostridium botulinum]MBY6809231.1 helix-turn-helix transcriptional regulator [Clostridium botulinum]MBY6822673.1 helix-turn-helix transcriptional regulator [Clostridium botulinum]MBY6833285.1 helix-turn-helix transcriptional regulator [Clostridium botulinum]MBY6971346.1 helix-turn-helix transcriptional regulator [Clostridium botulinum]MCS6102787.1 transcriptional regulator [Clostridium botulinum]